MYFRSLQLLSPSKESNPQRLRLKNCSFEHCDNVERLQPGKSWKVTVVTYAHSIREILYSCNIWNIFAMHYINCDFKPSKILFLAQNKKVWKNPKSYQGVGVENTSWHPTHHNGKIYFFVQQLFYATVTLVLLIHYSAGCVGGVKSLGRLWSGCLTAQYCHSPHPTLCINRTRAHSEQGMWERVSIKVSKLFKHFWQTLWFHFLLPLRGMLCQH